MIGARISEVRESLLLGACPRRIPAGTGKNPDLHNLLGWLRESKIPSQGEMSRGRSSVKFLWISEERIVMKDGLLYFRTKEESQLDLLLPKGLQALALETNHDISSAGHQGVAG